MNDNNSDAKQILEELRGGNLTFGQMIQSLRICDSINQSQLAKKLKISRSHLCDIEKGRRLVSAQRASQFAKAMGYSIPQFVAVSLQDQLKKSGLNYKVKVQAA